MNWPAHRKEKPLRLLKEPWGDDEVEIEKRAVQPPFSQYLMNKATRRKIPLSGTFELSPLCNFSCRMCYVRQTQKEIDASPRPILKLEQWLEIAEQARKEGMLYLLLTGGEPFLWPDFWALYEKLISMGFLISINTNGSLIDENAVERLKKFPPTHVNITLYGASDDTYFALCQRRGMFSRVKHAISLLQDAGIQVKLNCSLTPYNVKDLEEMVRFAENRKLILDASSYMLPPVRRRPDMVGQNDRLTPGEAAWYRLRYYRLCYGDEQYLHYLEMLQSGVAPPLGLDEFCVDPLDGKIRCRAGNASFWVSWDGWMMACGMMPEPREDLMKNSFSDCWKRLSDSCDRLALSGTCKKCPDLQLCHSCAAMAAAETGSVSGIPRYLCEMVSEIRKLATEELNNLRSSGVSQDTLQNGKKLEGNEHENT